LFALDRLEKRFDFASIDGIGQRWKALDEALASASLNDDTVKQSFELLKTSVISTTGLIHADRVRIIQEVRARTEEALELRRQGVDFKSFLSSRPPAGTDGSEVGPLGDPASLLQGGEELGMAVDIAVLSTLDLARVSLS
jgi:hypothetical protein